MSETKSIKNSYLPFRQLKIADKILNFKGSYKKVGNLELLKYKKNLYSVHKFNHKDLARLLVLSLLREKIDRRIYEEIDKNIGIPQDLKKKIELIKNY
ncbi:hypothetical protein V6O07_23265 [Arthrospira platensis SPKY2]